MSERRHQPLVLLHIHPRDNVAVAVRNLSQGQRVEVLGRECVIGSDVSLGAKIAIQPIKPGEKVVKYGEPIGSAVVAIQPGDHVHTHNLQSDYIPTPKAAQQAS